MNHASERLNNVGQIRRLLSDLEHFGLWKSTNACDQATIEDTRDEILRILNLIETELERASLWDRNVDIEKGTEAEPAHSVSSPSIEQIHSIANLAYKTIHNAGQKDTRNKHT